MAEMKLYLIVQEAPLSKSLVFIGENILYWKDRMEMHVKPTHYQL